MTPEDRSPSAKAAADRRLLRDWLEAEASGGAASPRLAERLEELSRKHQELAPLLRYLRAKEAEESARRGMVDREQWHRSLSFRFISLLFGIGGLGVLVFVVWGGEQAFFGALFFFFGTMTYYLAAQLLLAVRARRTQKAWEEVQKKFREELEALRQ